MVHRSPGIVLTERMVNVGTMNGERRCPYNRVVPLFILFTLLLAQLGLPSSSSTLAAVDVPGGVIHATLAVTPHLSVAASASTASVERGKRLTLFLDVAPNRSIHVYAPGAADYLPVAFKLDPQPGVTIGAVEYPKSEILFFEPLNERVPVYQKPFRLARRITVTSPLPTPLTLKGTFDYQACDDKVCFVPKSVDLKWEFHLKDGR